MTGRRRRTLALELLQMLVEREQVRPTTIARELAVSRETLDGWIADAIPMPANRQLLLAMVVIDRFPRLARLGYRLQGHARATLSYQAQMTKTHLTAPVSRFKPPTRRVGVVSCR